MAKGTDAATGRKGQHAMNRTQIVILSIVGALRTVGALLQARDANTTGSDDVVGTLMSSGADAATAYAFGDERGLRRALVVIRDGINSYLGAAGSALAGAGTIRPPE